MTPPSNVEPPPAPAPLVTPAQTRSFEIELVVVTNKMIEGLLDKRPELSSTDRRALERVAKVRCAEILKRAAVECGDAINGLGPGVKQTSS